MNKNREVSDDDFYALIDIENIRHAVVMLKLISKSMYFDTTKDFKLLEEIALTLEETFNRLSHKK